MIAADNGGIKFLYNTTKTKDKYFYNTISYMIQYDFPQILS